MSMRCAVVVAWFAGGCSCEANREASHAPEPPPRSAPERVAVPGAGVPAMPDAAPRQSLSSLPLQPEEGHLAIELPETTPPGVETTAHLRVSANRGYEINERFHYKLTLEPTPGITLPKTVFTQAAHDAERLDSHELAFAMKLTADKPGDYTVHGRLSFAVCKVDSQCLPKSLPIAVQIAAR